MSHGQKHPLQDFALQIAAVVETGIQVKAWSAMALQATITLVHHKENKKTDFNFLRYSTQRISHLTSHNDQENMKRVVVGLSPKHPRKFSKQVLLCSCFRIPPKVIF